MATQTYTINNQFGITVKVTDGAGVIESKLYQHFTGNLGKPLPRYPGEPVLNDPYKPIVDSLESLILAHACAGIDICQPAYVKGLEDAIEAIVQHELEE